MFYLILSLCLLPFHFMHTSGDNFVNGYLMLPIFSILPRMKTFRIFSIVAFIVFLPQSIIQRLRLTIQLYIRDAEVQSSSVRFSTHFVRTRTRTT